MPWEARHLEVLLAIARTGNLSRAAEQLGTDQPHVSRLLRRIEDHLGHPVFDRGPRGAHPTAAGAVVLERARLALDQLERLQHRDGGPAHGPTRLITHRFDARGLARHVRSGVPGLELVPSGPVLPVEAFRALLENAADVFVAGRLPHVGWPVPAGVRVTEVAALPTGVLVGRDHPAAAAPSIDLHRLVDATWAVGLDPHEEPALHEECRRTGGFAPWIGYRRLTTWNLGLARKVGHAVHLVCSCEDLPVGARVLPVLGAGATTVVVAVRESDAQRSASVVDAVRGFVERALPDRNRAG